MIYLLSPIALAALVIAAERWLRRKAAPDDDGPDEDDRGMW